MIPKYEVYALKYAEHNRTATDNFIGGDIHNGPMPLDYYIWVIRNQDDVWIVDIGFGEEQAKLRGRTLLRPVDKALALLNIDVNDVKNIIVTHLHYDHIGNVDLYPNANFHIQDSEINYATGRYMSYPFISSGYHLPDIQDIVAKVYDRRVIFHNGDGEIAPGITVHKVGGHTQGLQVVRVYTERGWIVLASDATHFYRNMMEERPFPILLHMGEVLEGYTTLKKLADSKDHIIPGHDPKVMELYANKNQALQNIIAPLHLPPIQE